MNNATSNPRRALSNIAGSVRFFFAGLFSYAYYYFYFYFYGMGKTKNLARPAAC